MTPPETSPVHLRSDHTDPVVVNIGSGAGGGILTHELTTNGVRCVVLEGGPHLRPDDDETDEFSVRSSP